MAKKVCKDCPEKEIEEIKATERRETKKYSFPTLWISVEAKNYEEAWKLVKAILEKEYKNKSI